MATKAPMIKAEHAAIEFNAMTAPDIHRVWRAISHQVRIIMKWSFMMPY